MARTFLCSLEVLRWARPKFGEARGGTYPIDGKELLFHYPGEHFYPLYNPQLVFMCLVGQRKELTLFGLCFPVTLQ